MDARLRGIVKKAKPPPELRGAVDPLLEVLKLSLTTKRLYEDTFSTPEDAEAFAIAKALPPDQMALLLLMQSRKNLYTPNATLDKLLTVVFVVECLGVWYSMSEARMLGLLLLLIVLADAMIKRIREWGEAGGRALSRWLHTRGFVSVDPLSGLIQLKKWTNQSWQLVVHIICTAVELHILSAEPWYDDPATVWIPHPFLQWGHHSAELELLYVGMLAVWIYTCFMHRFVDERRRDYFELYVHHVATIALVGLSWQAGYQRIGLLVMYVHDISDIPIDLLKMVNFLKLEGPRGWFASEIAYVTALVVWVYYRLYELPFRVMHTVIVLSYRVCAPLPRVSDGLLGLFPPDMPLLTESSILLVILFILHLYWTFLLVRVGYRIITESAAQASREEYEGESDVEDEPSGPASTKAESASGSAVVGSVTPGVGLEATAAEAVMPAKNALEGPPSSGGGRRGAARATKRG